MLRYEVKLNDDSIKREKLEWREKYLSPDLSYITGVTSPSYHLEKFTKLASTNNINNTDCTLDVECKNVLRQGYIIIKEKEYDVFADSYVDYSIINSGDTIEYHYVINKDKYFYWGKFDGEDKSGYTFNNLLNYDPQSGIVETIKVESSEASNPLKIDTVYWIEDGTVEIDGNLYIYDKDEGNNGILKYGEDGVALQPSAITRCKGIEYHPYSSSTLYEEVTKVKFGKQVNKEEGFDKITFARYYYYVKYKNHYCPVRQKFTDNGFQFVCDIPLYVLSAKTEDMLDNLETKEYNLYFVEEAGPEGARFHYEECHNDEHLVNTANLQTHLIYNDTDLRKRDTFIYIDEEMEYFSVEYNVLNANDGNEIIVYLNNAYSPLKGGEKIMFINNLANNHESQVYNSLNYNGVDEEYVIFNGKRYLVEENLLDKVIINNNEYDIDYSLSGKVENVNCLVLINGEKVPMLIKSTEDGEFSSGTLQRYGKIVTDESSLSTLVTYDIKPYSGITVNDRKYAIYEKKINDDIEEDVFYKYADIVLQKEYTFNVIDKIGSSTYVCEPDVNSSEFTDEFNKMISGFICGEVVGDQHSYTMNIRNKIFGEKEITKDLAFSRNGSPKSSDDYYDLFNDLDIFVKNGYIHIPLSLRMDVVNNIIQEDIVMHDFYEEVKKKAINPIVDMEKDVYLPKYIYGYYTDNNHESVHEYTSDEDRMYRGSSTAFESIYQINLNFHFRTRNNIIDANGNIDNWFITDFHPYCDILNNPTHRQISGDTLMQASDLMGFLNFTNDDIFYQRSRVAKSFARLSFYDSTDPQTQSLLATSCIFVDEHKLFKRFIDNSRKYEREYGSTSVSPDDIYKSIKISVDTEYLNLAAEHTDYNRYDTDCMNVDIGAEDHRISSRLVVDNKYTTDTSSEGFYLYMFREYAEKLHPKPIYMKVEFNHAGIGNQIPFLIPMHWTGNTENKGATSYNKMYPEHTLRLSNGNDLQELTQGIPLSYVYAQTYIPLYAVYDFNRKEYGYVFDERYAREDENGVLNLNLFEMKIMDESQTNPTRKELEDIKANKQIKAIINVNTKQFDKKAFNYEVE